MESSLDISGQVVIVTGGGKGVGRGITECFLKAGADVLICGRSEPDELIQIEDRHPHFVAADIRELDQIAKVIDYARSQWGRCIGLAMPISTLPGFGLWLTPGKPLNGPFAPPSN